MKAKIIIKNIKASCILGTTDEERKSPQKINVTIQLIIDAQKASVTDNIDDTVNYQKVYDSVVLLIETSQFYLLEALGTTIANKCLEFTGVKKVIVTISKFFMLQKANYVALEIEKDNE